MSRSRLTRSIDPPAGPETDPLIPREASAWCWRRHFQPLPPPHHTSSLVPLPSSLFPPAPSASPRLRVSLFLHPFSTPLFASSRLRVSLSLPSPRAITTQVVNNWQSLPGGRWRCPRSPIHSSGCDARSGERLHQLNLIEVLKTREYPRGAGYKMREEASGWWIEDGSCDGSPGWRWRRR